ADWLEDVINNELAYGVCDVVLSGFLRIVTHPRILSPPATMNEALAFIDTIRSQTQCVILSPGPRHWDIFTNLCKSTAARGNLVTDAYLAALAIESGSEWITTDRDFARFPGLRWRHPLS
ncbi:MAG: type II toxin-antitoxin system VapC family toxin, partial [Pirellulales bacterium]|nr:type II toxin-antitoxin system VapC family toxin [Pirellulales bacterium]